MAACLREVKKFKESEEMGLEALKIISEKYGEENIFTCEIQ